MKKIVVAKTGFNALTETDPNNLAYSSQYNTLKYYASGSLTINVNASANTFYSLTNNVTHNLNFLPFAVVFGNQPKNMTGYAPLALNYSFTDDGVGNTWFRHLRFWVTSTKLFVGAEGLRIVSGDSYTATFYYKIYRNKLNI